MPGKLGVYLCTGCAIGDSIDAAKLAKVATGECHVAVCRTHAALCGAEGCAQIRQDLAEGAVDTVVVAACSPRFKAESFSFNHGSVVERVNLREHVAWCHKPQDEDTQMLAEDYLRMGVARALKTEPLKPLADDISKALLVVGGGVTGITAAMEAAQAGYSVFLVEKEERLGGRAALVKSHFPTEPPYTALAADGIQASVEAVLYHPRIRVFSPAQIVRIEGQPGMFDVTLEMESGQHTVRAGAIVVATGWKPYDASLLAHLGYGVSPDVVTSVQFEEMAVRGPIVRPSNGRPVKRVLFIQCAGSRDKDHLPYCSSSCCMTTLAQTTYIHQQDPEAEAYVVYKDMRTPGQYERFYRAVQDQPLNFFTKGDVASVEQAPDGRLAVTVNHTLLGESIVLTVDLVVLATGMVPNGTDQILKLTYRQGPELPVLQDGFPDSHFVCFPYETRRTGIYAAGAARAPMDMAQARHDAAGAALKAIQCMELAARGHAVHPRGGDLSYPSFFLQRCTQCKRCTEECPFGALDEDAKGTPKPNLYRCRRCGICLGACPERIVSFHNYSVDLIASMIKAIEVPEEDEEKPRVLALVCENDAYPALDLAGLKRRQYDPSVRVVPLRCLGSLNIVWIADALSRGIDGVILVGCKYGDDYQCHFTKGSELAQKRLENVKETLQRLQLEPERLQLTQLAIDEWDKLPALFDGFVNRMRELGPNPYKGL
jgi:quinone-modifying oxidoreductase subunit QmoB